MVYRTKDLEEQQAGRCVLFCHQPHCFFSLHFTSFFEIRNHMVLGSDKIKSEHIKPMNDFTGQECVGHFHEHKLYKKAYILKTTLQHCYPQIYTCCFGQTMLNITCHTHVCICSLTEILIQFGETMNASLSLSL